MELEKGKNVFVENLDHTNKPYISHKISYKNNTNKPYLKNYEPVLVHKFIT